MCTGTEGMLMAGMTAGQKIMMGGQVLGGVAKYAHGDMQNEMAKTDAAQIRDSASQQAQKILRAGQRERSAARAATAASGARVDEFSMGVEREIDTLAEQDAAMAVLSGNRRARSTEFSGKMAKNAGLAGLGESLFDAGNTAYRGWKGKKDPVGDFYLRGTRGAGD